MFFSTVEFAEAAGITYRQADYWCRNEVLAPAAPAKGSGSRRRFDEREIRVARLIAAVTFSNGGPGCEVYARIARQARAIDQANWTGAIYVDLTAGWMGREMPDDVTACFAVNLDRCAAPVERATVAA